MTSRILKTISPAIFACATIPLKPAEHYNRILFQSSLECGAITVCGLLMSNESYDIVLTIFCVIKAYELMKHTLSYLAKRARR